MKTCVGCRQSLDDEAFPLIERLNGHERRRNVCRACHNTQRRSEDARRRRHHHKLATETPVERLPPPVPRLPNYETAMMRRQIERLYYGDVLDCGAFVVEYDRTYYWTGYAVRAADGCVLEEFKVKYSPKADEWARAAQLYTVQVALALHLLERGIDWRTLTIDRCALAVNER